MRAVHGAGSDVLTIGRGRRTSYAARRLLRGSADPLPVLQVDEGGDSEQVGRLNLAYPKGTVFESSAPSPWPLESRGYPCLLNAMPGEPPPRLRINSGRGLRMTRASVRDSGRSAAGICKRCAQPSCFSVVVLTPPHTNQAEADDRNGKPDSTKASHGAGDGNRTCVERSSWIAALYSALAAVRLATPSFS